MFTNRAFLTDVRRIALPITAQAMIMSLLLLTDQLMVGQLGETAVASVGLSAKITAIVTVVLAGLATGTTIFCAQYWAAPTPAGSGRSSASASGSAWSSPAA